MKIIVTYNVPTAAHGFWDTKQVTASSIQEADTICSLIEKAEYQLVDVTRDPYED